MTSGSKEWFRRVERGKRLAAGMSALAGVATLVALIWFRNEVFWLPDLVVLLAIVIACAVVYDKALAWLGRPIR